MKLAFVFSLLACSFALLSCSAEPTRESQVNSKREVRFPAAEENWVKSCSPKEVTSLLEGVFSNLGHNCKAYVSLFSADAKYYHQHDGFKNASELLKNCQSYAAFCPGDKCKFLQNGEASVISRGNSCHILVPYIWSELPANKGNLEPHTGWEYIVASPNGNARNSMDLFAELETTYSIPFDWNPNAKPGATAESTLHLLSTSSQTPTGECNNPIAPILAEYFKHRTHGDDVWRQQGDAVVLAAGNLCHVTVPFAAQVGANLKTGRFVFTLRPSNNTYVMIDAVEFPQAPLSP